MDITDVPVKSVPSRRRTVGNKEDKVMSLWDDNTHRNGVSTCVKTEENMNAYHDNASKDSILGGMEEVTY